MRRRVRPSWMPCAFQGPPGRARTRRGAGGRVYSSCGPRTELRRHGIVAVSRRATRMGPRRRAAHAEHSTGTATASPTRVGAWADGPSSPSGAGAGHHPLRRARAHLSRLRRPHGDPSLPAESAPQAVAQRHRSHSPIAREAAAASPRRVHLGQGATSAPPFHVGWRRANVPSIRVTTTSPEGPKRASTRMISAVQLVVGAQPQVDLPKYRREVRVSCSVRILAAAPVIRQREHSDASIVPRGVPGDACRPDGVTGWGGCPAPSPAGDQQPPEQPPRFT